VGELAAELSHGCATPVDYVNVIFHLWSVHILAEINRVEWGTTPISVETISPYVSSDMNMNGPGREPTSIAAYGPAGLLILYVLIRILF
jgi:hypothetical protein